jgi:hypothetical protein
LPELAPPLTAAALILLSCVLFLLHLLLPGAPWLAQALNSPSMSVLKTMKNYLQLCTRQSSPSGPWPSSQSSDLIAVNT